MSKPTDVELSVGLSTADVKKAAAELQKSIKDVFDQSSSDQLSAKLQKIQAQMSKNASRTGELVNKLRQMESVKLPTEEYKVLTKELTKAEREYDRLTKKAINFLDRGGDVSSPAYKTIKQDVENARVSMNNLRDSMRQLRDESKDYVLGGDTDQYRKTVDSVTALNNEARLLLLNYDQVRQKEQEVGTGASQAAEQTNRFASSWQKVRSVLSTIARSSFNTIRNVFSKLGSVIKKAATNLLSFVKAARTARSHSGNLGISLKRLLGSMLALGLGIQGLRSLFTRLRSAMTEGIKNIVRWQGESGQLNKSLSAISSSFATLKNSVGAAIAPLVNAFAPALVNIVNLLTEVINKVGMFFAALTGQKTFLQAEAVQKNFAEDLDNTGKNAKKAKKELDSYLSPIDELNKLQKKDTDEDESASGAGAGTGTFKEVAIDPKVLEFIERIKDMWSKGDFYELGKEWGEKLRDALESIPWDTIRETSNKIGKSLATLINGFVEVERLATDIGNTLAQGINTVFEFFNGFVHNLHWDSIGSFIANTFNGFFEGIDWELIKDTVFTGFRGLATSINTFIRDFHWDNISTTVGEIVDMIIAAINGIFDRDNGVKFGDLGYNLGEQLKKIIEDLPAEQIGETLGDVLHGIIQLAIGFLKGSKGGFSTLVQKFKTMISSLWNSLTEEDKQFLGNTLTKLLIYVVTFAVGKAVVSEAVKRAGASLMNAIFGTGGAAAAGTNAGNAFASAFGTALSIAAPLALGIHLGAKVAEDYQIPEIVETFRKAGAKEAADEWEAMNRAYSGTIGKLKMIKDLYANMLFDTPIKFIDPLDQTEHVINKWEDFAPKLDEMIQKNVDVIKSEAEKQKAIQESESKIITDYTNASAKIREEAARTGNVVKVASTDYTNASAKVREEAARMGHVVRVSGQNAAAETKKSNEDMVESTKQFLQQRVELENQKQKKVQETTQVEAEEAGKIRQTTKEFLDERLRMAQSAQESQKQTTQVVTQENTKMKDSYSDSASSMKRDMTGVVDQSNKMEKDLTKNADETKKIYDKDKWNVSGVREGLATAFNLAIDKIKSIWNSFARWLNDKLELNIDTSSLFGRGLSELLGTTKITLGHIPYLAQGAVIPPNKEFMAVLGDQKSGTNIETPLSTMVDAFNTALQQNGGAGQSITLNLMLPNKQMIAQYAIEGGQVLQMSRGRNPFLLERG